MGKKYTKKFVSRLFDTFNFRNFNFGYVQGWRNSEKSGQRETPLIDALHEQKIPFKELDSFFEAHGGQIYEILKKLTLEEMMSPRFEQLTPNEKAMMGAKLFQEFCTQLRVEILELNRTETEEN